MMGESYLGTLDQGGGIMNSGESLSEQVLAQVQEEARQAKQVAQQLQQSKQENTEFADFLVFLLQKELDDELIRALYDSFFLTKDPKT